MPTFDFSQDGPSDFAEIICNQEIVSPGDAGSVKRIGPSFHQTEFAKAVGVKGVSSTTGQHHSVGTGYCNGIGLDWIRRVLLSQPDRDQAFLTYSKQSDAKRVKTVQRSLFAADALNKTRFRRDTPEAQAYIPPDYYKAQATEADREVAALGGKPAKKTFGSLNLIKGKRQVFESTTAWMKEVLHGALMPGNATNLGFTAGGGNGPSHAVVV